MGTKTILGAGNDRWVNKTHRKVSERDHLGDNK